MTSLAPKNHKGFAHRILLHPPEDLAALLRPPVVFHHRDYAWHANDATFQQTPTAAGSRLSRFVDGLTVEQLIEQQPAVASSFRRRYGIASPEEMIKICNGNTESTAAA